MTNELKHLKEGDHIPETTFKIRVGDAPVCGDKSGSWEDLSTQDIFEHKKIIVVALPGAFTPTCSSTHLPGYEIKYGTFKALGVDEIYCLSVNDSFVMNQWADKLGVSHVKMLADGNAEFTRKMGMLVKKENLGFGDRSWRYSMFVENGVIEKLFVEPGFSDNYPTDPFEVSDADTMLGYIQSKR